VPRRIGNIRLPWHLDGKRRMSNSALRAKRRHKGSFIRCFGTESMIDSRHLDLPGKSRIGEQQQGQAVPTA
jgi:hypothetical protein